MSLVGLLLLCFCETLAKAEYLKYKDPKQPLNVRIKDLLGRMTMEEKIGQMVQIERVNASTEVMKKYFIGKYLITLFLFLQRIMYLLLLFYKQIYITYLISYFKFLGSVLSGGGSAPSKQASAKDWVHMVNKIQKGALSTRLGIPMIYGIDAVHGHNNVYNATIFPHNIGLGATM